MAIFFPGCCFNFKISSRRFECKSVVLFHSTLFNVVEKTILGISSNTWASCCLLCFHCLQQALQYTTLVASIAHTFKLVRQPHVADKPVAGLDSTSDTPVTKAEADTVRSERLKASYVSGENRSRKYAMSLLRARPANGIELSRAERSEASAAARGWAATTLPNLLAVEKTLTGSITRVYLLSPFSTPRPRPLHRNRE